MVIGNNMRFASVALKLKTHTTVDCKCPITAPADQKKAEDSSVEDVFTTERASENVREYFAEAVEAYLTFPKNDDGEIFRTGNSNPGLQQKNPELFNYLVKIFHTDFPAGVAPAPPPRPLFPEFVPDPDTAVVFL